MKLSKKTLYSALALTMLTSASIAPVAQIIPNSTVRAETVATRPNTTKVHLHKLQATSFPNGPQINTNGEQKSLEQLKELLGTEVSYLNDVTFTVYQINSDVLTKEDALKIKTKFAAEAKGEQLKQVAEVKTSGQGLADFNLPSDSNQRYLFIESETPNTVSSSVAVPFVLELPISNKNGTGFETEINVYPKNVTADVPVTDKDVTKLGNDDSSYNIGQDITWYLKATVPSNIGSYELFKMTDQLSDSLTLKAGSEVSSVKFGNTKLESNDYTVTVQGQLLTIEIKKETFTKLQKLITEKSVTKLVSTQQELYDTVANTNDNAFLTVEVNAFINEKAILGKRIENNFSLIYDNTPNNEADPKPKTPNIPPQETPEVHTGGKKFLKRDKVDNHTLEGAEFNLYSDSDTRTEVLWTDFLIKANAEAIAAKKFTGDIKAGKPIILRSNQDGSFEIRGLGYGGVEKNRDLINSSENTGFTNYYLKETKAPAGYVIPEAPIQFIVNQTSYNKTPTKIDVDQADADPQEITNTKRPEIPNTGGIGTAIFVAIGAAVMAFAAKGMKRRTEEN
ncbi:SpaH/EbpB family LPXTG-anchored major pilin [Streptococcus dysgalactiae subsp. equisimilis]|uniref:SpaH/EbpB family LPXTG-anchored major pilin n=2 Tax=Streptococcus dysgalactiae TaxID=1334 RepID=UPI001950EFCB|nr:SpaH/EbpB family LPXTG-anchored major pilin [Streptococcus dysgalactiae]MBM6514433.1 SpaH/EbpB family LPXTG-anchored major pilin [Streptococcus dysgalactiae subsp. equisimilis]